MNTAHTAALLATFLGLYGAALRRREWQVFYGAAVALAAWGWA